MATLSRSLLGGRSSIGAEVELCNSKEGGDSAAIRDDLFLMSESHGRYLISCLPENLEEIEKAVSDALIPISLRGKTGGRDIVVNGQKSFSVAAKSSAKIWQSGFGHLI